MDPDSPHDNTDRVLLLPSPPTQKEACKDDQGETTQPAWSPIPSDQSPLLNSQGQEDPSTLEEAYRFFNTLPQTPSPMSTPFQPQLEDEDFYLFSDQESLSFPCSPPAGVELFPDLLDNALKDDSVS